MGAVRRFNLPDAGEGLTEAEIVSWRVKPGDVVEVNDIIVEIETAKSLVELPVPFAGTVTELLVDEGRTVDVGTAIIAVDTGGSEGPSALPAGSDAADPEPVLSALPLAEVVPAAVAERTAVLVGYGVRHTEARRRPRLNGTAPVAPAVAPAAPAPAAPAPAAPAPAPAPTLAPAARIGRVLAKPPVRKFAKDLGVDLAQVIPSDGEVVTRADVTAYATRQAGTASAPAVSGPAQAFGRPIADARETRLPVKGVRKATAAAMVASAFTAPHVTEFVTVDVTRTMKLVRRLREDREFADVKVSPLLVVAKALLLAVRRHPGVNASWDGDREEIVLKHYVNLGIAAATPRGLVVPNIKDADRLTLFELAEAMGDLVSTAREGRTQPAQMSGGTITITNVGVYGVDTGTPILNPGEAAILAFGVVRQMPWVVGGKVRPRWVTTLALSFDHRLVDGELGSRFLADLARMLERPDQALVWG